MTPAQEASAMAAVTVAIDRLSQTDRGRDLLRRFLIIMRMAR